MFTAVIISIGLVLLLFLFITIKEKWRKVPNTIRPSHVSSANTKMVHRLCPHNNVVQRFAVEKKDSLDDHLDVLTRKLAEKEGRLRLSKSKIRETQNEIDNLHAIDNDVREKYKQIMDSLRSDLTSNETECKRIQERIEWVSRRRAELHDEVQRGQKLYSDASAKMAINLKSLRNHECKVTDKPHGQSSSESLRQRKEPHPHIPGTTSISSIVMKCKTCTKPVAPVIHCHD